VCRKLAVVVVVAATVAATACTPTTACAPLDGSPPAVDEDPEGRAVAEPQDDAASLFDRSVLHDVTLVLAPEDLATLDAAPAAEVYVPGTFELDGERVGPVGIRYKGNVGSWVGCLSDSTPEHPGRLSGHKTCPKLNFKIDFHELDDDLDFHGLHKLELHAMNRDPSMMREQLGFALYRQSGVPAPRTAHARVVVNGVVEGVFLMVEAVDGRFLDAHFEDGDGNLYQDVWPTAVDGFTEPPTEALLRAALETHEDEGTDVSGMLAVGRAVQDARGLDRLWAVATGFSVAHTARFLAVDRTIRNDDGPVRFYCDDAACRNHNYFVYQEQFADRLWLVPWDLDLAFVDDGPTATDVDRQIQLTTAWDDHHRRCVPRPGGSDASRPQLPAGCDPLLGAMSCGFHDPYEDAVDELLGGPLRADVVDAELDAWSATIAAAVDEAHRLDPRQPSPEAWAAGLDDLRRRIDALRSRAERR
jgi:spore coat protein CotH